MPLQAPADDLICSARRCRSEPDWALAWNNPALHAPDYRKVWLACPAHLSELRAFLEAGRGFAVEVLAVQELSKPTEASAGEPTARQAPPAVILRSNWPDACPVDVEISIT